MCCFFFFKQKTAYEMRISDWSSDVCSSDLWWPRSPNPLLSREPCRPVLCPPRQSSMRRCRVVKSFAPLLLKVRSLPRQIRQANRAERLPKAHCAWQRAHGYSLSRVKRSRSEANPTPLHSIMPLQYDVICMKHNTKIIHITL